MLLNKLLDKIGKKSAGPSAPNDIPLRADLLSRPQSRVLSSKPIDWCLGRKQEACPLHATLAAPAVSWKHMYDNVLPCHTPATVSWGPKEYE